MGASLTPLRGTDSILWTVKFRDGQIKRFKYPIRTTPWGSIEPFAGFPQANPAALKNQELCGQSKYLGVADLPKVARA